MNPAAKMLLVFWVMFGLVLAWSMRGVFWLQRGNYRRARRVYERQQRGWNRSVRDAATYNLALCLFHEDRLEEALVALEPLDSDAILPAVRELGRGLTASTLLLLERDPGRALRLIASANQDLFARAKLLQQSYAALLLGDERTAERRLREADTASSRTVKVGAVVSFGLKGGDETMCHALRGMIAEKLADDATALREYGLAVATGAPGVYAKRAREALGRVRAAAQEPVPPSLVPVTRD